MCGVVDHFSSLLDPQLVASKPHGFILDGCSFHVAHEWWKRGLFPKKIGFDDSFDVTECLQQIGMPDLLNVCA